MKLALAESELAWVREVQDFVDQEYLGPEHRNIECCEDEDFWRGAVAFTQKVADRGWLALTWPKEYGGLERPVMERYLMAETFFYNEMPLVGQTGWGFTAGALLSRGSEEQKRRYLPKIAKFEMYVVEGFSEPDSGSDLASLTTRADRNGSSWIMNGQKTYTTFGTHGDWIVTAARTDQSAERHQGISMFLVPVDLPGIWMHPMPNLGGGQQNHTFFENVKITEDMLIGQLGQGWQMIMSSFYGAVAGNYAMHANYRRRIDELLKYSKTTRRGGRAIFDDEQVQTAFGELQLLLRSEQLLLLQSLQRPNKDRPLPYAGTVSTVVGKENRPRYAELMNQIAGPLHQLSPGADGIAPLDGWLENWYRVSLNTHGGGTPQVKRMVLATRGLGLPRQP
jgi:3-oxocholest-4-en-26-oyl-CoA dehydrogenase alpha subunit